ncbi:MORN repeat-containing protein 1 [Pluvialis apricaria]
MASLAGRNPLPLPGDRHFPFPPPAVVTGLPQGGPVAGAAASARPRAWRSSGVWADVNTDAFPRAGQDKQFFKDGSYCEGMFVNGETMGNGFQYWVRNAYSGQFVFGELHGHKILQYKDGGKYEGELFCGRREGKLDSLSKLCLKFTLSRLNRPGQWRNDVFNERGAIVNCSGDICDGLWINGYPAACGSFGGNNGGAGVSKRPMKRTTAEWIFTLQPMEAPRWSGWIFPEETAAHGKPTQEQVLLTGAGACGGPTPEQGKNVRRKEQQRGTVMDWRQSQNRDLTPCMEQEMLRAASMKGGKKPSGRISAEKAEKMTVSQEKMEDSRSHVTSKEFKLQKDQHLIKNSKTLQGQYVLMVSEVTIPPFLGQTLTPAFKLLNFSRENQNQEQRLFQSHQQVKRIKPHS